MEEKYKKLRNQDLLAISAKIGAFIVIIHTLKGKKWNLLRNIYGLGCYLYLYS